MKALWVPVLCLILSVQPCKGRSVKSSIPCWSQCCRKKFLSMPNTGISQRNFHRMELRGGSVRELGAFSTQLLESDLQLADSPKDVIAVLKKHKNETFESITNKYILEKLLATLTDLWEEQDAWQWFGTIRRILARVRAMCRGWEKPQSIRRILMNLSHIMRILSGNTCFKQDCLEILHMQNAMCQKLLEDNRKCDGECLADIVSALAATAFAHFNATQRGVDDFPDIRRACKAMLQRFVDLPSVTVTDVSKTMWACSVLQCLDLPASCYLSRRLLKDEFTDLEPSDMIDLIWSLTTPVQPDIGQINVTQINNDKFCRVANETFAAQKPIFLSCNHTLRLQMKAVSAIQNSTDALDMADVFDLFQRIPLIYCNLPFKDEKLKNILCIALQNLCKTIFRCKERTSNFVTPLRLFFMVSYSSIILSACERGFEANDWHSTNSLFILMDLEASDSIVNRKPNYLVEYTALSLNKASKALFQYFDHEVVEDINNDDVIKLAAILLFQETSLQGKSFSKMILENLVNDRRLKVMSFCQLSHVIEIIGLSLTSNAFARKILQFQENDLSICLHTFSNLLQNFSIEAIREGDKSVISRFVRNLGLVSEIQFLDRWSNCLEFCYQLVDLVFSKILKSVRLEHLSIDDIRHISYGIARLHRNFPHLFDPDASQMQTLMVEHIQQMLCDFQHKVKQNFKVGSFDRRSMLAGIFVLEAMAETGCSAPFHFLEQVADYLSDKQTNADFHLTPALSTSLLWSYAKYDSADIRILGAVLNSFEHPSKFRCLRPNQVLQLIESISKMSQLVECSDISIHSRDRQGHRPIQASKCLRQLLEARPHQHPVDPDAPDDSENAIEWAATTSWSGPLQNVPAGEDVQDIDLQTGPHSERKSAWKIILGDDPTIIDRYPASKSGVENEGREGDKVSSVYHPYISNTLLPIENEHAQNLNTVISNSRSIHGHFLGLEGIQGLLKSLSELTFQHVKLSNLTRYTLSQVVRMAVSHSVTCFESDEACNFILFHIMQHRNNLTTSECLDVLWSFTYMKAKFGSSSWQEMELFLSALINQEGTNANRVMTMGPDDLILFATCVSAHRNSDVGNEAMHWVKQRVLLPEFLRMLDEEQAMQLIWAITWHGSMDDLVHSSIQDAMALRQSLRTARVQENMATRLREILEEDDGLESSQYPAWSNETKAIDLIQSQILWNTDHNERREFVQNSDDSKCIICSEKSPQVLIQKSCIHSFGDIPKIDIFKSVSPGLRTCPLEFFSCFDDRVCNCRPQTCRECIALWVLTCFKKGMFPTCPTCRVKFCLADVVECREK
mmetsp:Transcript_23153/g.75318  ORF Transcript_23153/g.75318 Transcript_23153/m.75318 type:complete len:1305 (-) Transcript_23153:2546-6460(-)